MRAGKKVNPKMIGIYCIRHIETSTCYIGKSIEIPVRFKNHKNGTSQCPSIRAAILHHGIESFAFEILEHCPESDLNDRERFWITTLNTFHNGYNETTGGGAGSQVSDKTRAKMSQSRLGNQNTKGRKLPPEHRANISKGLKGSTIGEKNGMYGKKLTPSHREAISKAQKGKPKSRKHRKKIGDAQRGEKGNNYGKKASPETREKMRKAHKKRWKKHKIKQSKHQLKLFD